MYEYALLVKRYHEFVIMLSLLFNIYLLTGLTYYRSDKLYNLTLTLDFDVYTYL